MSRKVPSVEMNRARAWICYQLLPRLYHRLPSDILRASADLPLAYSTLRYDMSTYRMPLNMAMVPASTMAISR